MKLAISLAQMDVKVGDSARNLATAADMIREAARRGSRLVLLPELWLSGYDLENAAAHAVTLGDEKLAKVAALAREQEIAIFGSLLLRLPGGGVGNTAVYMDAGGQVRALYSKVHLFGPMAEKEYLREGQSLALVQSGWAAAGLAICYDLRFPEVFRTYALAGADLVLLCAQWPRPRLEHWRVLLRARAIENQMMIVACNRVGRSGDTEFFGHSAVIDACGETVIEGGAQEDLLSATVDMAHVRQVRASMPVFDDRRPAAYAVTNPASSTLSGA